MAGGQGSRLRPLTLHRPKPMVEVVGIPVIEFVKDALVQGGVDEIIITTGYRGESLANHVESWNSDGLSAWVNEEEVPMGTAGSVKLLANELTETFIVGSGDTLASFDIAGLLALHKEKGAMATMALWQVEKVSEYGVVGLSETKDGKINSNLEKGWVARFQEKPSPQEAFSNVINAGLYILEPEVLDLIPEGEKFDWSRQVFPQMLELGMPLYACLTKGIWFDIGRPSDLLKAQNIILENRDLVWTQIPEEPNSESDVKGTCDSSIALKGSFIAEGSIVKESLLMAGAAVSRGCKIESCIIGRNAVIQEGCILNRCVIGDGESVPAESEWNDIRYPNDD
ncbi:MAG: sugar phosphate nucleotidyltransferase [Candidatus Poseidoniales archaeon]